MAFATVDDVTARLMRTLTDAEQDGATLLLDAVAAEIAHETKVAADAVTFPDLFRFVSVEAACRELASPIGATSTSEQLGQYSYDVRYRETGGTFLTDAERQMVLHAQGLHTSTSVQIESIVEDVQDFAWDLEINES